MNGKPRNPRAAARGALFVSRGGFRRRHGRAAAAAALFFAAAFCRSHAAALYEIPYARFHEFVIVPESGADVPIVLSGFRRVAADIAFVQLLQYTGGSTLPEDRTGYGRTKELSLRAARLDTNYYGAYLFGAQILAWLKIVNRPQEALDILREGTRRNPDYWPFRAHVAAILSNLKDQPEAVLAELTSVALLPDCPVLTKSVLATMYKTRGRYAQAAAIWKSVLDFSSDPDARRRAAGELERLIDLAREGKAKGPGK